MEQLPTSESHLLEQARAYDAQALAEIYDRYAAPIYRYLYRYVGDAAQAEDLTSEVFVRLLHALDTPRAPRDQLRGWLYQVAHNLAMDWFRQGAKMVNVALDEGLAAGGDPPATAVERLQDREQLRAAIRQLTPDQQCVVLLRFGEGLKIAEVSQLVGKSEGAVKILQHRAIKRLRKLLGGAGREEDG